jgi:predicted  nucleic acid-binding Zn-ribbon protein
MAEQDLRNLWKLHLIDASLHEIRQRAAALDPGRKLQSEIAALTAEHDSKAGAAKALSGEQTDLELQQKAIDEKLKKIDKELYGGKVVNPREVAALQKEIAALKSKRGDMDGRILELWEELPPIKKAADEVSAQLQAKQKEMDEYQKKLAQYKATLETEFKERSAKRGPLAQAVPPALLARYDAIRQKYGATGMANVSKNGSCEACGTNLPAKLIEGAKEGRIVTCEACHRILYVTDGLI